VGSKARIVFDDLNALERIKIFEKGISLNVAGGESFGEFLFALRDGDIISPKVAMNEPLAELCREFLDCIGSRKRPLADAANGVDVVRVMAAIQGSLMQDGARVPVKRG
jgi:predicted dehydrogenase